jgi:hypothetical protein
MTDARAVPATGSPASGVGSGPWLDAERLVVYRVALEFLAMVPRLVPARGAADLRDQVDRASSSIVLNIGEGPAGSRAQTRPASSPSPSAAPPSARCLHGRA